MSTVAGDSSSGKLRIGIDLGGTKIEFIALGCDGAEMHRHRVATPRGDYDATVRAIKEGVEKVEASLQRSATVGVGIPGTISQITHTVKNANSTWMNGRAFDRDLGEALRREVRCANDANCLAVSEATDGAGAGKRVVFAVVLGTGCGGGIAVDGRVHNGRNGVAGEWGHTTLPWMRPEEYPGPECYFRYRPGSRLRAGYKNETAGQGNHRALRRGRSGCAGEPGTVRGSADAESGANGEHPGSRRNCIRRRRIASAEALPGCATAVEEICFRARSGYADKSGQARGFQRSARCGVALAYEW
jgi:ROK family